MVNDPNLKAVVSIPRNFHIDEVDPKMHPAVAHPIGVVPVPPLLLPMPPKSPLGPLAAFTGNWKGRGFNTIFRPNNAKTPTKLPAGPAVGDNVLELNVTEETLSFSDPLGAVPNRGSDPQGDIFLNGAPYLQSINDITDPAKVTGIHLEPGMWIISPATTAPNEPRSVARMASIPHGTTIHAEGTFATVAGPPLIPPVNITPTTIGGNAPISFPSQIAANAGTARIPQDLSGPNSPITQAMITDPNSVLRNAIAGQTITSTTVLSIATLPRAPLNGGGTDNTSFLRVNANAVTMTATFWIETVEHTVVLPVHVPGQPVHVQPRLPAAIAHLAPTFELVPPAGLPVGHVVKILSTQIQYTQTVVLDFAGLHWPHVSVATLVPTGVVQVPWP